MERWSSLRAWIEPQHLQPQNLTAYTKCFESHGARLILLRQFLQEPVAERLSKFLCGEAEFHSQFGLYSKIDEEVAEAQWLKADEEDRFFRLSKLRGASPKYQMSVNMLTYLRFRKAFQDPGFREFFQEVSGLMLGWSDDFGAHSMERGDFLRPHTDENRNRSLALVIYLSPNWEPRFGGALNVIDRHGHRTKIDPEYNSLVAFDVAAGSTHFVDVVSDTAGNRRRLTIGGWYHKRDKAEKE